MKSGGGVAATERFGTLMAGAGSDFATVSVGAGAGLVDELQPGVAKMRTRANTWMPTTMPKILRIFIGGVLAVFWGLLKGNATEYRV